MSLSLLCKPSSLLIKLECKYSHFTEWKTNLNHITHSSSIDFVTFLYLCILSTLTINTMRHILHLLSILFILNSCAQEPFNDAIEIQQKQTLKSKIDPEGMTISTRFSPPIGYSQTLSLENSYSHYLQNLPLKPFGEFVTYYNGQKKTGTGVYISVIDLRIGKRDLHQCADAVIRLRAEYLWNEKRYNEIHFNFTNGFRVDYSEWMKGRRIIVKGNKTYWSNRIAPSNTYNDFWKYMVYMDVGVHACCIHGEYFVISLQLDFLLLRCMSRHGCFDGTTRYT